AALAHPSPGVRRNAVQVLRPDARAAAAVLGAHLLADPDGRVRLAALLALADQPPSAEAAAALAEALRSGLVRGDRWLADAATAAAARNDLLFLKAMVAHHGGRRLEPDVLRIVERVAEHWARGGPVDQAGGLLLALRGGEPAVDEAVLRG